MPAPPDPPVILLLMRFSQLPTNEQTQFLDLLNTYLYASPQRRTRLREDWRNCCSSRSEGEVGAAPGAEPEQALCASRSR